MPKVKKYDEEGNRLQAYPKGKYELMEPGDPITALIDIGIKSLRTRPPKYEPTPEGLELFQQRTIEYFQHLQEVNESREKEQRLIADVESWCVYLQITRATLGTYRKSRGKDWAEFIDRTKDIILALKKDQAMRFKAPPMVYIFDAVNNFGYRNTNQVEIVADHREEEQTIMEDEIVAAGLVWNEETGEFESKGEPDVDA